MDWGKAMRVGRAARGFSQRELARLTGLDASYVSLIETGRRTPSLESLQTIATALRFPVWLFALVASDEEQLRGLNAPIANMAGRQLIDALTVE